MLARRLSLARARVYVQIFIYFQVLRIGSKVCHFCLFVFHLVLDFYGTLLGRSVHESLFDKCSSVLSGLRVGPGGRWSACNLLSCLV